VAAGYEVGVIQAQKLLAKDSVQVSPGVLELEAEQVPAMRWEVVSVEELFSVD
jgi:hypothetical protein